MYGQAGTTISYEDELGALTLTYAGLVNGKHSYSTPIDNFCLLYTSPSPRDRTRSRMPSSA